MSETKDRILDAAERLISEQGFGATSLRHIIAEAGVNLAAVHYHFGSKQELLDHVIMRRAEPVNAARLEMLEAFEKEAQGGLLPVERILEAFMIPMAETAMQHPNFVRLMGRMHAEGMMPGVLQRHFQPVVTRFLKAFRDALPGLPEIEVIWRAHFMIGAMAVSVVSTPVPLAPGPNTELRSRLIRLITFLGAGFRAPAPVLEEVEVQK